MARQPLVPFGFGASMMGADPFLSLHREVNRLFDDALRGTVGAATGERGGGQGAGAMLVPQMDVAESDKELRIVAEMPGVTDQDLDITLEDDVLTIRGEKKFERKEERQDFHFTERSYGTFQRSLRLPFQANPDDVQARFENGVLTVTVRKAQKQERSRRIQVQSGPGQQAGQGGGQSGPTIEGTTTGQGAGAAAQGSDASAGTAGSAGST